jgi:flagellar biosynthesis/type III secretory pathway protein FliH
MTADRLGLPRARVVRQSEATQGVPLLSPGASTAQRRRIAREELDARLTAERLLAEANARVEQLLRDAREEAASLTETVRREAAAEAEATLAARWMALRQAEGRRAEDVERVIVLAVALAERLVGEALALDPARIATLARGVLVEARGARRALVVAHPLDAEVLRHQLSTAGLDLESVVVETDEGLARGALRLHTDVGIIDAQLASRLDRLAHTLRDALR